MARWRDPLFGSAAARRRAVEAGVSGLAPLFPARNLGLLELVCTCGDCIDSHVLPQLMQARPADLGAEQLGHYFSAAPMVPVPKDGPAQVQALGLYLAVLRVLSSDVLAPRETERSFRRAHWFVEPEHWIAGLFRTGFAEDCAGETRAVISQHLKLVTEAAIGGRSARLWDVLGHWGRFDAEGFVAWIGALDAAAPLAQLLFWVGLGETAANSPAGRAGNGVTDIGSGLCMTRPEARAALLEALAASSTGRLLERYAMAARDEAWFDFLARLSAWRDNTIARSSLPSPSAWYALDQPVRPRGG